MSAHRSLLALLAAAPLLTTAQRGVYTYSGGVYTVTEQTGGDTPLASKHFDYPFLPEHADSGDGPRGVQQGYNICNSSTVGPDSWCQTGFLNALDDFCLWGSPRPNETVAQIEEEMVAYCTSDKYGSRILPQGALQGVQFIQTPDYVEIVGMIDQTGLGLQTDDSGGEEDPHGADQRGNPLGSLLYSSAFGAGPSSPYKQVIEWSYFVGGGVFCFKACDPAGKNAARLCEHVYDRIGCAYNDPANYAAINGTFQSCLGDNQLPAGVYVDGGVTKTYYQPDEALGPITTIPYVAAIPATSSCTPYTSSSIYTALGSASSSAASSAGPTSAPSGSAPASASNAVAAASTTTSESSDATRQIASLLAVGLTAIVALLA